MGRGSEKAALNMVQQNVNTLRPQQQQALQQQMAALGDYRDKVNEVAFGADPWEDPTYQAAIRRLVAGVAHGGGSTEKQLGDFALRTGTNSANIANVISEDRRTKERNLMQALAGQKAMDWDKRVGLKKFGITALGDIPKTLAQNYRIATEGMTGATGAATGLAMKPGTGEEAARGALGAGGAIAAALAMRAGQPTYNNANAPNYDPVTGTYSA